MKQRINRKSQFERGVSNVLVINPTGQSCFNYGSQIFICDVLSWVPKYTNILQPLENHVYMSKERKFNKSQAENEKIGFSEDQNDGPFHVFFFYQSFSCSLCQIFFFLNGFFMWECKFLFWMVHEQSKATRPLFFLFMPQPLIKKKQRKKTREQNGINICFFPF